MSLPAYTVYFRGKPACPCLAKWLAAYERELLKRGVIKHSLDIYQLIGSVAASSNTHSKGGAFDLGQTSDEAIWVARQMGADATWHRPYNWDGRGGISHSHGVLRGCPHNFPARYQIDAVDAGYNGLGAGGRGGRDTGPRPLSHRTWTQGIEWHEDQPYPDNKANRKPPKTPAGWKKLFKASAHYVQNSVRGVDEAEKRGFSATSFTVKVTADEEEKLVGSTFLQPLKHDYVDPTGKLDPDKTVGQLTLAQLFRLRAPGNYQMHTVPTLLAAANKKGLRVELELGRGAKLEYGKGGFRILEDLHDLVQQKEYTVQVKVRANTPGYVKRLKAAHRAGFTTILVTTKGHRRISRNCWPYVDYVRGPVIWTK